LKKETILYFNLGFAPFGWKNLYLYLRKLGFQDNEVEQAGLVVRSEKQELYDRFRARIMFPIHDFNGRIVGFTGRVLPQTPTDPSASSRPGGLRLVSSEAAVKAQTSAEPQAAKYINTPETVVYQKNKILYGFFQAKDEIKNKEQAVLVEGNLDVLMGWQEGLRNLVAVSGTGLSEFQLKNLKRFCQTLVLSFDMDKAGELATDRSIGLAYQAGFDLKVLTLPEGKDLADYAKDYPDKVSTLLNSAKDVMEYYFAKVFSGENLGSVESKKKAVAYLLPRIKFLKSPVEQTEWLSKLASQIRVPEKMLFEEFSRTLSILETGQDIDESLAQAGDSLFIKTRWERLAEKILGLALRFPELISKIKGEVSYFPFRLQEFVGLITRLDLEDIKNQNFPRELEQSFINYFYLLADYELSFLPEKFSPEKEFSNSLQELKKSKIRFSISEISLAIKEAEAGNNLERAESLMKELNNYTRELGELENQVIVG
jgi:DNA primase